MALDSWLIDTSALNRVASADDSWLVRIERGLVRICTVTLLEVGFSTRNGGEHRATFDDPPISLMPTEHMTPAIEMRALEVQMMLADRGEHRAPSIPDLLVAATAELKRLTILHLDKDFELISSVTGQRVERLTL